MPLLVYYCMFIHGGEVTWGVDKDCKWVVPDEPAQFQVGYKMMIYSFLSFFLSVALLLYLED